MFQSGIQVNVLADRLAGRFPQPVQGLVGVALVLPSGTGVGEKEPAGLFHQLNDMRFESRVTRYEVLDVGLGRVHQLPGGNRSPDDEHAVEGVVVLFVKRARFRGPAEVVFQPEEDRPVDLRDGVDDFHLPLFRQPSDGRFDQPEIGFLGERRHFGNAFGAPGIIHERVETVHHVVFAFRGETDELQKPVERVQLDFVQHHRGFGEKGLDPVDEIRAIPLVGGGFFLLFRFEPFLEEFDDVGPPFAGVLFEPERTQTGQVIFVVRLDHRKALFGDLAMVHEFSLVPGDFPDLAAVIPRYNPLPPVFVVGNRALHDADSSPGMRGDFINAVRGCKVQGGSKKINRSDLMLD